MARRLSPVITLIAGAAIVGLALSACSSSSLKVAVQKGTVQEQTDMPPKVKACATAGKPIDLQIYGGQDQVTAAVATGKADAMLADSPVVAYAIKQSGGKIEAAGAVYDSAPYGYVVPKAETEFAQAIADALKSLETSGAYKKVLSTWGNEAGAINNFAVNPPVSTPSASSAPATSQAADAALVAKLPAKIKSAGQIVVGTDATYAPNEFLNADGKTVQGMDVDLFNAVMQKFGIKVEWTPASFDSIITGVQGGKYDVGVSSFTINNDRMKQVNMVSYFNAGTQWATAPGNPKKVNPQSPCGLVK
jgi:ABC-type amino acid transport substrate-binding protein